MMASFEDFLKLDFRVGTILEANIFKKANKPAYQLKIDFGSELGIKQSSAQITDLYSVEQLIGTQIVAIVNFPPKNIAGFLSEVLVLGFPNNSTGKEVVLIQPTQKIQNGSKLA